MTDYDAIVVGARCAGSPTAMLLASQGYRVLVVDRSEFPSDALSTHLIHTPGVAILKRWGLFDALVATGAPPIDTYLFDFGPFSITGSPGTKDSPFAYAPRRISFDWILVEAAAKAGAEVRERFTVDEILIEDGRVAGITGRDANGKTVTERARVVVGADGRQSVVARAVRPEQYLEKPPLLAGYYSYYSGLPMNGRFESHDAPRRGMAMWPTDGDLTLVIAGWPHEEFEANKHDIEGNLQKVFDMIPDVGERIAAAKRETKIYGATVPNYFRKPYGPGWALVGDAGYNLDFITAQGMQDAFRDAELCAAALDQALAGARPYDEAMERYRTERDERSIPMYEFTAGLASLMPPPPEVQQVLGAIRGNQEAIDAFVRVAAGALSPAEFFSDDNIAGIMAAAAPA